MKLIIAAVGKLKKGAERDLVDRFAGRIAKAGQPLALECGRWVEVPESRQADAASRKRDEADALKKALPDNTFIVALDEDGHQPTSRGFAGTIADERDAGRRDFALVIGGADGLDPDFIAAADERIAFGRLTWPHQIVRILAAEQYYRAVTILAGHPYHRD